MIDDGFLTSARLFRVGSFLTFFKKDEDDVFLACSDTVFCNHSNVYAV